MSEPLEYKRLIKSATEAASFVLDRLQATRKTIVGRFAISKTQTLHFEQLFRDATRASKKKNYKSSFEKLQELCQAGTKILVEARSHSVTKLAVKSHTVRACQKASKTVEKAALQFHKLKQRFEAKKQVIAPAQHALSERTPAPVPPAPVPPAPSPHAPEPPKDYETIRRDVELSGFWDETAYTQAYYEPFIAFKEKKSPEERFTPLDYYIQEGWKHGFEPQSLKHLTVDPSKSKCCKIFYLLNTLRYVGFQYDTNIWIPNEAQVAAYLEQRSKRVSKKVIYTCIADQYDALIQPYHIESDWDYVCFTDDEALIRQKQVGVWTIEKMQGSSVQGNRWYKMHPHVIFPNYEQSLYIDGNINILSPWLFEEIAQRNSKFLVPRHFVRNCIYDEIDIVLRIGRISPEDQRLIKKLYRRLEREVFPKNFGLSENNILFREHHDPMMVKLMSDWWEIFTQYAPRDQSSLSYVFWKNLCEIRPYFIENARFRLNDFAVIKHGQPPEPPSVKLSKLDSKYFTAANVPSLRPAFESRNIASILSTNEAFIPYLGVAIYSLLENSNPEYNYDIIVLSKGIPDSAFRDILSLADGRANVSIRLYDTTQLIESLPREIFHVEGYVPVETYNKCFITDILSGYDRCAYLDSDIILLEDVQKLHDMDLKGHAIGASPNVANIHAANSKIVIKGRAFNDYLSNELGIGNHTHYFQAGILVLDMAKIAQMDLRRLSIQKLLEVPKPIFFDQCIYNSIFYGDTEFFSTAWNHVWYLQNYSVLRGTVSEKDFFDYAQGRLSPKILHYAGKDKPQTKLGWNLEHHFWEYALRSPFREAIQADIERRQTEVAPVLATAGDEKWYLTPPRLLVHVHLYYHDQLPYILKHLGHIKGCNMELHFTVTEASPELSQQILESYPDANIHLVENLGYDIHPFLQILQRVRLANYDYVLKIHTKNARGEDGVVYGVPVPNYEWRNALIHSLIGSPEIFESHLHLLQSDLNVGSIGAGDFIFSTKNNEEERNYSLEEWRDRCGIESGEHYIGGSMFLSRAYPLERIAGLKLTAEDFRGKTMHTRDSKNLAHVVERLLGLVIEGAGFQIVPGAPYLGAANSEVSSTESTEI